MRVTGRITAREAYRVEVERGGATLRGVVPEALMGEAPFGAPRHQPAYIWLSDNEKQIADALVARAVGRTPPAPFDAVAPWEDDHAR